jgi:lipopolysaccharide transport system permease protein
MLSSIKKERAEDGLYATNEHPNTRSLGAALIEPREGGAAHDRAADALEHAVTLIKARSGWQSLDLRELYEYRDLIYFMAIREIKGLYAQTILGLSWAAINPLIQIVIFSVIFGGIVKVTTDGIPYVLFSSLGIIPWTYMSQTMTGSSLSLVQQGDILTKVYFPRLVLPIVPALTGLLDFAISGAVILVLCIYYRTPLTWNLALLPLFTTMMAVTAIGAGILFSAVVVRFRDLRPGMPYLIRLMMYSAPVIYSASGIQSEYRMIFSLNPFVGVIEGFRACILGTPFPWIYIWPGAVLSLAILVFGLLYFKRLEKIFVDIL